MSILIKGMKMPKNCETCEYQTKGACFASGVNKGTITIRRMGKERPDWCPLVEIKTPHGRLIDADALVPDICRDWEGGRIPPDYYSEECIREAPTVIEAEGER